MLDKYKEIEYSVIIRQSIDYHYSFVRFLNTVRNSFLKTGNINAIHFLIKSELSYHTFSIIYQYKVFCQLMAGFKKCFYSLEENNKYKNIYARIENIFLKFSIDDITTLFEHITEELPIYVKGSSLIDTRLFKFLQSILKASCLLDDTNNTLGHILIRYGANRLMLLPKLDADILGEIYEGTNIRSTG